MKRSEALAPLSRDHHVALVVARELSRSTEADAEAAATRFVEFLARHELAHFALEEAVLLPALGADDPATEFGRRVREDHEFLRSAMRRLEKSPRSLALVHDTGARLRAHVQMEERELFPYLERTLEPAELDRIGAMLVPDAG
jgi:hemerythrin-like domain-containing protein